MYDQDGKEKRGKKKLKAQLLVEIKNSYGVPPPSLKKKKLEELRLPWQRFDVAHQVNLMHNTGWKGVFFLTRSGGSTSSNLKLLVSFLSFFPLRIKTPVFFTTIYLLEHFHCVCRRRFSLFGATQNPQCTERKKKELRVSVGLPEAPFVHKKLLTTAITSMLFGERKLAMPQSVSREKENSNAGPAANFR